MDGAQSERAPQTEIKTYKYKEMSEDGRRYHPHHHSIAAMSHVDGISAIGPKNKLSVGSCDKMSHIEIE